MLRHVISVFMYRYHEWMKNPTLQYLTSSEPLTLDEEFEMQKRWLEDEDSNYLGSQTIILAKICNSEH